MSRQIKFRAWDVSGKCMIDWATITQTAFNKGEHLSLMWRVLTNNDYTNTIIPMQFTGTKDKNGNEIYEGDILKCNWLAELGITELDCEALAEVKWDENNPCFYAHLLTPYKTGIAPEMHYEETNLPLYNEGYSDNHSFEVVGNIYEKNT